LKLPISQRTGVFKSAGYQHKNAIKTPWTSHETQKEIHRFSIPGLPRGAFCKEAGSGSWHWMDSWEQPQVQGVPVSAHFNPLWDSVEVSMGALICLDVSLSNIIAKD